MAVIAAHADDVAASRTELQALYAPRADSFSPIFMRGIN